ncbi:conserved hypothetical protein [Ricinus communis]|uniref:Uncharacterized protein n=1 Tax=Ricinus communis TaxID=3988 RepID=B9RRZ1_RICCO|nr:conserved hypothetical protein [Ricinus communis]
MGGSAGHLVEHSIQLETSFLSMKMVENLSFGHCLQAGLVNLDHAPQATIKQMCRPFENMKKEWQRN